MQQDASNDTRDPEERPQQVAPTPPLVPCSGEHGYREQLRLIAEHVLAGGSVDSAPRPDLGRFETPSQGFSLEGIQQARLYATEMVRGGHFDAGALLTEFKAVENLRQEMDKHADVFAGPGTFERPEDWDNARVHTTVTRLFTDKVVHDVEGVEHEPDLSQSILGDFTGPVMLLGRGEFDLGVTLDGQYRLDLIDAAANEGGSGVETLRLLWGSEESIVGAIKCGELNGYGKWVGFGPAGAAQEFRSDDVFVLPARRITTVDTASGTSYWFASAPSTGTYGIFLAVDKNRQPVGAILDSSGIANYYWFVESEQDYDYGDWPENAREFDAATDAQNPNEPSNGLEAP